MGLHGESEVGRLPVTASQFSGDSSTNAYAECRLERHRGLAGLPQDLVCGLLGSADAHSGNCSPLPVLSLPASEEKRGTCVFLRGSGGALSGGFLYGFTLRLDHTFSCGISGVSVHQRTPVPFHTLARSLMRRFLAFSLDCLLSELYYKRC